MPDNSKDAPEQMPAPNEPAGEVTRDKKRKIDTPRAGGESWEAIEQRGDNRYGKTRVDDADPLELVKAGQGENDDDESPAAADPELADAEGNAEIESGGGQAGFGRGEEPRKPKSREPK